MAHLGVDIDGVIADFATPYVAYHNERYGTNYSLNDIYAHDLWVVFNLPLEEFIADIRRFFGSNHFYQIQPFPEVVPIVRSLAQEHQLCVVTSRFFEFLERTRSFIGHYFDGCFQAIHCTYSTDNSTYQHGTGKGDLCKRLGVDLLVDDCVANVHDAVQHGVQAVLVERPWNVRESLPALVERVPLEDLTSAIARTLSRNGNSFS